MPIADYLRSTPFKIAAAYAGLFSVSVVVLFGAAYWLVADEMKAALRTSIEEDTHALLGTYRSGGLDALRRAIDERMTDADAAGSIYSVMDGSGAVLIGYSGIAEPFVDWREFLVDPKSYRHTEDDDLEAVLGRGTRVGGATLVVARSLHGLKEVQEVLLESLTWTLGLTVVLALLGGVALGHGAVRRLERINRTFQEIIDGDLSRRVPIRGRRDEVDHLASNINRMLDRIAELMANLQQVTSDIAHDLRTPLSRLRQGLEAVRRREASADEYQAAVDHAIEQTDSIFATFSALLRIAQIESKVQRSHFVTVDLSEVARRIVDAYESVVEDAGQSLCGRIAGGVEIHGDRDLLAQMLANLVENAAQHCPSGTEIVVAVEGGPVPMLSVADTGPGVPAQERDAVLRRFYRLEKSRTTPGSGLGLALVKAIAEVHGATMTLEDNRPGLRVSFRFPAAAAP